MPFLGFIDAEVVAVSIPVIAIMGGIALAIVAVIMGGRKKELEHKERILAMEKGLELPPAKVIEKAPKYSGTRTAGFVLLFLGLTLWFAISVAEGFRDGVWGLLPAAIGAGMLVGAHLEKTDYEKRKREQAQTQS